MLEGHPMPASAPPPGDSKGASMWEGFGGSTRVPGGGGKQQGGASGKQQQECRICLEPDQQEVLVSACGCSGTQQWAHYG